MNFKCWPKHHHEAFEQRRRNKLFCSHGQKKVGTVPNYQPMINRGYQAQQKQGQGVPSEAKAESCQSQNKES